MGAVERLGESLARTRNGPIAALDIGTTKTTCFIARVEANDVLRVVGIGHQAAHGMRAGAVVDMDAVEASILSAVHAAEQMAGETIREAAINVSCGDPGSRTVGVELSIAGHPVANADLRRIFDHGRAQHENGTRDLIHCIPVGFTIDASRGIRDPRGMFGERLGVDMHLISANTGAVRTLATCVARCHLDVTAWVMSGYASGLACLVEDELDLGATVIDMGGGTTTIAVFLDGEVAFTDSVPLGGNHVTKDIARGLSTPLIHAERMKTLYGGAMASPADDREIIDVQRVGEEEHGEPNHLPRAALCGIIRPRMEEIFELVRDRLRGTGFDKIAGRRAVLTGGASQLQGARDLASTILDKQVRCGRPMRIAGLAEAMGGPAFATCAGLLTYVARHQAQSQFAFDAPAASGNGTLSRIGLWLRENF